MADWQDLTVEREPLTVKKVLALAEIAAGDGHHVVAVRLIEVAYELLDIAAAHAQSQIKRG
jgi:hypothetical protein